LALSIFFSSQLTSLGWDSYFDEKFKRFASNGVPARVVADYGAEYLVHDGAGPRRAAVGRHVRNDGSVLPAVGDWVSVLKREPVDVIHGVIDRRTAFSRKSAGVETREQVLAANVDVAFVVAAATDVNPRRIERYLTLTWQSGAVPIVLITKADIAVSPDELRAELEAVSM
jgi:ribosome biogenesis GTPase / thiamine phosphate phosphatase